MAVFYLPREPDLSDAQIQKEQRSYRVCSRRVPAFVFENRDRGSGGRHSWSACFNTKNSGRFDTLRKVSEKTSPFLSILQDAGSLAADHCRQCVAVQLGPAEALVGTGPKYTTSKFA